MNNPFIDMIAQIIPISPELRHDLTNNMHYEEVPKNHKLLGLGQICRKMYFIKKGFLRSFYYRDGEEITNWFLWENDVAFSLLSFHLRIPSIEVIETVEDCELFTWTYDDLQELYRKHVELNIVGRIMTEQYYCESEERMIAMRKISAVDRYQDLMKKNPEIIKRASNKSIASYLGMAEGNLSRIKQHLQSLSNTDNS